MSTQGYTYKYSIKELPKNHVTTGMILFAVGLVLSVLGFIVDPLRATFNSLIVFVFLYGVGLGAIFFTALEYLVGAVWSVPFRRVTESLTRLLYFAPIFAIPTLINNHDVFHWTHTNLYATDEMLANKAPYLNTTFFFIRIIGIYLLMSLFTFLITRNSEKQDTTKDQKYTTKNKKLSAMMMPVFALCTTLLGVDFIMSLEPHWFSTIFGVYYFAGSFLSALAFITVISVTMNENGNFGAGVNKNHYYSLGALLFGFTNFWGYIAFSQYILIWYANIPEETFWFINRWEGSWAIVSIGLIIVHFIVPYFFLLTQTAKKDPVRLKLGAIWLIFAHFYDLYWLVMPTYSKDGAPFGWMEIAFPVMAIGFVMVVFSIVAKKKNMIPIGDPKLRQAMKFHM
jgi:hypothetical protein